MVRIFSFIALLCVSASAQIVNGVPNQNIQGSGQGVNTFGDSITNGAGATTFMQGGSGATGYAWQLINAYGGGGTNYAFGGDMAGDLVVKLTTQLSPNPGGNFLTTIMDSTNDVNVYGTDVSKQAVFAAALADAVVWAATPTIARLQIAGSPACTFTGTWTQSPVLTGGGLPVGIQGGGSFDTTSGDTVSCTFTTFGTGPIYLSYLTVGSGATWDVGANFNVQVDGGAATNVSGYVNAGSITTANGIQFFPALVKIPGSFVSGTHTVLMTNNHTGQGMLVFALLAPYPSGTNSAPPNVFVGGTPWNQNNSPATTTATYNTIIQTTVNGLAADGLNVHFVDVRNFLNSTSDYTGATLVNGFVCPASAFLPLHPNDCGHAHIAQAFLASMPASNFSGPLPLLTYFGPVRSLSGGNGWVPGAAAAWQVGTNVGFTGTTGGCTAVAGILTGCGGSVSGSGTIGLLPAWSTSSVLADSNVNNGTFVSTFANKLDMSALSGFPASDFLFSGSNSVSGVGPIFRAATVQIFGTTPDLFMQLIPHASTGNGIIETFVLTGNSSLYMGTMNGGGNSTGDIFFSFNRVIKAAMFPSGGLSLSSSPTDPGVGTLGATKGVFSTFDTAAGFQSIGTKFTTTGCSVSSTTGGGSAGTFTIGANTCSVVVTMNGATGLTATNGWSCFANDRTSATVFAIQQTASSSTTATFSIPATAGATDVINFGCTAY